MTDDAMRVVRMLGKLVVCISLMLLTLFQTAPAAQAASYTVTINDHFQCPSNLKDLQDEKKQVVTSIPSAGGTEGVISFVLKVYQTSLFSAMAYGYCAVQKAIENTLMAGMLLLTIIFGLTFLLGLTKFSLREAMLIVFKMALVMLFAMNAQFAMNVVFKFFLGLTTDMVDVLNGSGTGIGFESKDSDLSKFSSYFNDPKNECASTILLFFSALTILFPVLGAPLVMMLVSFIMIFVRAVLGFLTALGALSLLMAASPLFIAFALFKATHGFFERWLKSMISYSLQMTIVFFIFWASASIFNFYDMFTGLERSLSMMPDSTLFTKLVSVDTPKFCTPCEGFQYTGGVGFDNFTCKINGVDTVIPYGSHAPALSGSTTAAIFTYTLKNYAPYILTNITYILVLLWGVMEMITQAPAIAFSLAGDASSMALGGRAGRTDTSPGMEERYSFDLNGIDRKMDNFAYGFKFGYDPNFQSGIKDKIRATDPEYLKPQNALTAPLERFGQGFKVGMSMASSDVPAGQLVGHLPDHLAKQKGLWDMQTRVTSDQAALEALTAKMDVYKAEYDSGKMSRASWEHHQKAYDQHTKALEGRINEMQEKEDEYLKSVQFIEEQKQNDSE